jgi:hypothetical protein
MSFNSSMSHEMVKAYVKQKLATGISAGIIKGTTKDAEGHTHKFAVRYDEIDGMFVGETSFDGQGPHTHYIMLGKYDVQKRSGQVNIDNAEQPRGDMGIVDIPDTNLPENLAELLVFWNLKEITLETSPAFPNAHTHALTMRFAGKKIDRMGRKIEAAKKERSAFSVGLENATSEDVRIEEKKKNVKTADEALADALTEALNRHRSKDLAREKKKTKYE